MTRYNNQKIYADRGIVQYYAHLSTLQPAEETILALLQERLLTMKMLDLGVGGGRTTKYFAPLVAEYIGLDYSPEMITACKKRFFPSLQKVLFEVGDARDLSRFKDNYFDFILFSFNGIDYISHSDRLLVFSEIHRVGKSGGYFCFSSHNLQGMEKEFEVKKKLSLNPFTTYVNLVMLAILRWHNPSINLQKLRTYDYAIIRDEPHNFRLQTYYVRPQEQLKQLDAKFKNIKVYSWKNGQEISSESELVCNRDMWLYYLCII